MNTKEGELSVPGRIREGITEEVMVWLVLGGVEGCEGGD